MRTLLAQPIMDSSDSHHKREASVEGLPPDGKCFWSSDDDQSNVESHVPNGEEKFHESTELPVRRHSRYGKQINASWELFSEYTKSSSLHGVKYVGEKRRHWIERTWWAFAFIISLVVCGKLISDTFLKWQRHPVIVTFAEQSTQIWDIPFPAVTLCPHIKTKRTVFNYTKYWSTYQDDWSKVTNLDPVELSRLKSALQVCNTVPKGIFEIEWGNATKEVYANLKQMGPAVSDIMFRCDFSGHASSKCPKWFKEVWTEEGLCYTFNMLNGSELYRLNNLSEDYPVTQHNMSANYWNINSNYKNTESVSEDQIFPYRVFGASDGLTISLKVFQKDLDSLCGGSVDGFKLMLHPPNEVPQMSKYFYRVPMKQEVIFSVKPIFMDTSDALKAYDPKRRQCYFENERHLAFYKAYTQRNCELECFTNYTIQKCGCCPFYMPRNSSTPICGLSSYECHNQNKAKKFASEKINLCGCLPSCSSLSYDVEFSQATLNIDTYYVDDTYLTGHDLTRIYITFKDNQFFASRRAELYGKTDFLANCGGLLGLFMGFSFLSLVEVVYFCTLRLACNLQRRHVRRKNRMVSMN